jgi:hypothetical protein
VPAATAITKAASAVALGLNPRICSPPADGCVRN